MPQFRQWFHTVQAKNKRFVRTTTSPPTKYEKGLKYPNLRTSLTKPGWFHRHLEQNH